MGMYDDLRCDYPLPVPDAPADGYQTKSLDRLLDNYRLDAYGKLWRVDPGGHEVPWRFTGTLNFYRPYHDLESRGWIEFDADLNRGRVTDIRVRYETGGRMTGINDLVHEWETDTLVSIDEGAINAAHADRVRGIARTAWRDVATDPPAESDADDLGCVFAEFADSGRINMTDAYVLRQWPGNQHYSRWARIRDVLLFPG